MSDFYEATQPQPRSSRTQRAGAVREPLTSTAALHFSSQPRPGWHEHPLLRPSVVKPPSSNSPNFSAKATNWRLCTFCWRHRVSEASLSFERQSWWVCSAEVRRRDKGDRPRDALRLAVGSHCACWPTVLRACAAWPCAPVWIAAALAVAPLHSPDIA